MYKDRPVILEITTSTSEEIDLDLFFDRFRWVELSLGFACTGNSYSEDVSQGLWELNDVTQVTSETQQVLRAYVNLRVANGILPFRPLLAVWDLALPMSALSSLQSFSITALQNSGVSPIQRDTFPGFYQGNFIADEESESWGGSVTQIDKVLAKHEVAEQGRIESYVDGSKASEGKFFAESFRPAAAVSAFEAIQNGLVLEESWCIAAIRTPIISTGNSGGQP